MTITKVFIICGLIAVVLTLLVEFVFKKRENWLVSFLQNFCGAVFLFSGIVKAVDPLGTAYKMEQYFAEFQDVFASIGMESFSKIFPWFSSISASFAVFMIVLELVVGVALVIGFSRFWTALVFFATVVFFTILTGFTHFTGYVPSQDYVQIEKSGITKEVLEGEAKKLMSDGWVARDTIEMNFFKFSKWVPFEKSNQKVTDCGCFGDFLVLEPKTSFKKDLFLFLPAFILLFWFKKMHQVFKPKIRWAIVLFSVFGFTIYNMSNYKWDIPDTDFRPFKNGVNIAKQKAAEIEAAENTPVFYVMTNKADGKKVTLDMNQFMSDYKKYPKTEWDIAQERGEPAVAETKISSFEVSDLGGNDVTDDLLSQSGYSFMIVSYKLKHETGRETVSYNDTTYVQDTLQISKDSVSIEPRVVSVEPKTKEVKKYIWDTDLVDDFKKYINPLAKAGAENTIETYVITAYAGADKINSFKEASSAVYPFYTADDILLKTIVRSNPGILLMKEGQIIKKWHKTKLPSFEEIKSEYIK